MMMRIAWSVAVVGLLAVSGRGDDEKQKAGSVTWAKDYPKSSAAGVAELKGEYTVAAGWTIKEAFYLTVPRKGGIQSEKTKLAFADGTWGTDAKGKIVPAEAKVGKGEWNVLVRFVFEKKQPDGTVVTSEWQAALKSVEVK